MSSSRKVPENNGSNGAPVSHSANRPLLARGFHFRSDERRAFRNAVNAIWRDIESEGGELTLKKLLQAEKKVILSVGVEADLSNKKTCRIKILGFSSGDERRSYVDLLLTLANFHFKDEQYLESKSILESVLAVERNNWHALKERAIVAGYMNEEGIASYYFTEAKAALPQYRERVEVEDAEAWEADAYEVYFRAVHKPSVSPEDFEPLFSFPSQISSTQLRKFYSMIIDLLIKKKVPPKAILALFDRSASPRREETAPLSSPLSSYAVPLHLRLAAEKLAEMQVPLPLPAEFVAGLDEKYREAVELLYARGRIADIFARKREGGEAEAREIAGNLSDPQSAGAKRIGSYFEEELSAVRQEAALSKLTGYLRGIKEFDFKETAGKIGAAFGMLGSHEAQVAAREEVDLFLRRFIGSRTREAILLADELWIKVDVLRPALSTRVQSLLETEASREIIKKCLTEIRWETFRLAREVAEGNSASRSTLRFRNIPDSDEFKRKGRLHDFFFVRFRELPLVRDLFREIEGIPYAEPVPLASDWFVMMVKHAENPNVKVELFERALAAYPNHMIAKIELARQHTVNGDRSKSNIIIDNVLRSNPGPAVTVRLACIKTANLSRLAELPPKVLKGVKKTKAGYLHEAVETYAKAQTAWELLSPAERTIVAIESDMWGIELNVARLYLLTHDFEKAMLHYERVLKIQPGNEAALIGKGRLFILLGQYRRAVPFYKYAINTVGPNKLITLIFRELALDALIYTGNYDLVLDVVGRSSVQFPDYIPFHLKKALVLLRSKNIPEANKVILDIERKMENPRDKIEPNVLQRLQGALAALKAELHSWQDVPVGRVSEEYEAALHTLSSCGFEATFKELEACASYVESITHFAIKNKQRDLFIKAVELARRYIAKYPFSPLVRQAIIAPLLSLDKETEALGQIDWLLGKNVGLTTSNFINLLLLATSKNGAVAERARGYILIFRGAIEEDESGGFDAIFSETAAELKRLNPQWDGTELVEFLKKSEIWHKAERQ